MAISISGAAGFLTLAAACAALATPRIASAQALPSGDKAVDEVVVTGSRLKRRDFLSPSPISTVERSDIAAAPQATLEELLNQMPQLVPDLSRTSNNPGNGTARINLRGMGAERTLVLVNSRRQAPSGVDSAVDINNIPKALIERIEIITGGASAVYGSDALAGVVNFITKDDFTGFSVESDYGITERGDAAYRDLNVAFGRDFAYGRGNIVFHGGYFNRDDLFASERDLTRVVWREDTGNGTLFAGGSTAIPDTLIGYPTAGFADGPGLTTFNADGTPRQFQRPDDLYNYQEANYLQTPLTRHSAGIMSSYEFANGYELYFESGYTRNKAAQELAPVPVFAFSTVNTDNPILAPETRQFFDDNFLVAPDTAMFFVQRRLTELGPRQLTTERDYWRTVAGVKGEIGDGWAIDGWLSYTRSDELQLLLNDASASRFNQALLVDPETRECFEPVNGCVPLDIFGAGRISADAVDFIRMQPLTNTSKREQLVASVFVTGSPFENWSGPVDIATGIEWRGDSARFIADDALFSGDTLGFRGDAPVDANDSVSEVYAEAAIPLLQNAAAADYLGLEVGVRYSDFENSGGVWTHKLGSSWEFSDSLRLRAMYQSSVRAPNSLELFQQQFAEVSSFVAGIVAQDPCSASANPIENGHAERCIMQGLAEDQVGTFEATPFFPATIVMGGNRNLKPEKAQTLTIGAVYTPTFWPDVSVAIDYYDIEITDAIGAIDASMICFDPSNTANLFCDRIRRGPTGDVVEVSEINDNRGLISTRGIDTQLRYSADLPDSLSLSDQGAQFNINMVWTHLLEIRNQENPISASIDCTGFFGSPCAGINGTAAADRIAANFGYVSGPFSVTLASRWISGTKNFKSVGWRYFGGEEPVLAIPGIGSEHFVNLHMTYDFNDRISASAGIANLFDNEAPLMADATYSNNTDSLLYDVFGRSYNVSFSVYLGNGHRR